MALIDRLSPCSYVERVYKCPTSRPGMPLMHVVAGVDDTCKDYNVLRYIINQPLICSRCGQQLTLDSVRKRTYSTTFVIEEQTL